MNSGHISEEAIQQFLWDKDSIPASSLAHLGSCQHCMQRIKEYKLLFDAVELLEKPSAEVDIDAIFGSVEEYSRVASEKVITKPSKAVVKKSAAAIAWSAILALSVTIGFTCLIYYFFAGDIADLTANLSINLTLLIVVIVVLIAILSGADEIMKFNKRLAQLDLPDQS